jgi:hypothetical protein
VRLEESLDLVPIIAAGARGVLTNRKVIEDSRKGSKDWKDRNEKDGFVYSEIEDGRRRSRRRSVEG